MRGKMQSSLASLPKLPIPQLQFVIKLRVMEVTTGCVSTGEPMVHEDELCRFLLRQCWKAWGSAAFPDRKLQNYY